VPALVQKGDKKKKSKREAADQLAREKNHESEQNREHKEYPLKKSIKRTGIMSHVL
jgi:hypothetical protein